MVIRGASATPPGLGHRWAQGKPETRNWHAVGLWKVSRMWTPAHAALGLECPQTHTGGLGSCTVGWGKPDAWRNPSSAPRPKGRGVEPSPPRLWATTRPLALCCPPVVAARSPGAPGQGTRPPAPQKKPWLQQLRRRSRLGAGALGEEGQGQSARPVGDGSLASAPPCPLPGTSQAPGSRPTTPTPYPAHACPVTAPLALQHG